MVANSRGQEEDRGAGDGQVGNKGPAGNTVLGARSDWLSEPLGLAFFCDHIDYHVVYDSCFYFMFSRYKIEIMI